MIVFDCRRCTLGGEFEMPNGRSSAQTLDHGKSQILESNFVGVRLNFGRGNISASIFPRRSWLNAALVKVTGSGEYPGAEKKCWVYFSRSILFSKEILTCVRSAKPRRNP
jgi:hypothetical protein